MIENTSNNIFSPNFSLNLNPEKITSTQISDSDFKQSVHANLQTILRKTFSDNLNKQIIKETKQGFNFACPLCRDSSTDSHKKRGNIALNGPWAGRFKCFNCGQQMKLSKFFHSFEIELSLSELTHLNTITVNDNTGTFNISNNITSEVINRDEAYKWGVDRQLIKNTLGLMDVNEYCPDAVAYLKNRCQYNHYERYLYNPRYKQIYILNSINDRVIGYQYTHLVKQENFGKYITRDLEYIRETFLHDKTPIPAAVSKLSCIFNIFNVDFANTHNMPVLVTEGPFDAFLLPNCIATAGAGKNFQMAFPFWYVFDSDETGKKHAMEQLMKGYNVFMWKKFCQDYNLPNRKKWDITDVMTYIRDNNITKPLYWSPYFTNSMLNGLNV